jgi:threonylcarbamoyladenosine tRNA methylthiotransferase MtaB
VRIYFHTFGCKANQYDTEVVRQALESAGAVAVDRPEDADAAIVNSCTVTHVGEAKMRTLVRRIARQQPDIRTVVMGCAAALDDGDIAALPQVSAVVGGADPSSVASALGVRPTSIDPVLRRFAGGTRAWLKIQDGCDEHCTFCATTTARGANRSRPVEEILLEAQALAGYHHEIVLTGVHIGSYGQDLDGNVTLGHLVERLVTEIDAPRYRLSSVEATEVCERLRELMIAAPDRLAPHLHAPLQSGSDTILKRMGRHWYSAATYRDRCESLAASLPVLGLGADVMVGFPGETDSDFTATHSLVQALPFTYLHVFPYSERVTAAARKLGPPVLPEIAFARSAQLRALAEEKQQAHRQRRAGAPADVIVLGHNGGRYRGLTEDYLDVYLPSEKTVPPRFNGTLDLSNGTLVAELS